MTFRTVTLYHLYQEGKFRCVMVPSVQYLLLCTWFCHKKVATLSARALYLPLTNPPGFQVPYDFLPIICSTLTLIEHFQFQLKLVV